MEPVADYFHPSQWGKTMFTDKDFATLEKNTLSSRVADMTISLITIPVGTVFFRGWAGKTTPPDCDIRHPPPLPELKLETPGKRVKGYFFGSRATAQNYSGNSAKIVYAYTFRNHFGECDHVGNILKQWEIPSRLLKPEFLVPLYYLPGSDNEIGRYKVVKTINLLNVADPGNIPFLNHVFQSEDMTVNPFVDMKENTIKRDSEYQADFEWENILYEQYRSHFDGWIYFSKTVQMGGSGNDLASEIVVFNSVEYLNLLDTTVHTTHTEEKLQAIGLPSLDEFLLQRQFSYKNVAALAEKMHLKSIRLVDSRKNTKQHS
jgi:hypothetical protein